MAQLKCVVVTPESTALDQEAKFVAVPLYDGELGIGVGHSPMIGRLGFGELRIVTTDGKTIRYYVDGGFVQVADNTVSLLTQRCVLAEKLDKNSIDTALSEAMKRPVHTDELLETREKLVQQARAQLAVLRRS
ncbi:MAG: ATP synthase F1 subunit epsilon [Planctomycetales bacterium]|nr:ATP synthase F1 subunit epsilon [Planctomycetales bacterium]